MFFNKGDKLRLAKSSTIAGDSSQLEFWSKSACDVRSGFSVRTDTTIRELRDFVAKVFDSRSERAPDGSGRALHIFGVHDLPGVPLRIRRKGCAGADTGKPDGRKYWDRA